MDVKKVVVTGGSGQISYSLLFRIANGDLLGKNQLISLSLLEIPSMKDALKGVVMELNDCCFPLVKEINIGVDPYKIFEGADYALFVGAKPRGPNMERKDLLAENGKIFIDQGKAINKSANKNVKVLVVGNPCNTNCLIAMHYAPDIPRNQFFAMTRLDQNRAKYQLAVKAGVPIDEVSSIAIWGNHSSTQMPDFVNAKINNMKAMDVIQDRNWLENDFVQTIQQRGSKVIEARGKSSAASAANAAIDTIQSLIHPTLFGDCYSIGVFSEKNPYGIDEGLIFSFPCRTIDNKNWDIVPDFMVDGFLLNKIKQTEKELKAERDMVANLLKG